MPITKKTKGDKEKSKAPLKNKLKDLLNNINEKTNSDDVLVLNTEHASKLTEKRNEIIETIKREDLESIRDLARKVDRDPKNVLEDVRLLFKLDIIDVEKEGGRKIPEMAHDSVIFYDEIV